MRLLIAAVLCIFPCVARAQDTRPLVQVIGTGGTIGSSGNYWGGQPTCVAIERLAAVPGIDSVARAT